MRLLRRTAVIGIAIGWRGGAPEALAILGLYELPAAAPWMLTGLTSLTGIACGIGYAALFGLLALRLEGRKPADEAHRPDPSADRDLSPAERAYGVPRAEAAPARTGKATARSAQGKPGASAPARPAAAPQQDVTGAVRLIQAQYMGRLDRAQTALESAAEDLRSVRDDR